MACYVTGIAPTENITALEDMLGAVSGIDRTKLKVITTADETEEHESSFLNFIHAGGGYIDSDTSGRVAGQGTSIMTGSGGTGVPGIGASPSQYGYLGTSHITRNLGTLPIPPDEVGNYNDALDDGRTVIAYECSGESNTTDVEAAFRAAGVRHVKTFAG